MPKGPIVSLVDNYRRYPRIYRSVGFLTACGLFLYEKHRIQKLFTKLVTTKQPETDKKKPEYIYIKFHLYKESLRKQKQREEEEKKWINVIINPIGKWWKYIKHSVAWRLLNIAQTGSHHERLKAVRQLAKIDHLKDWDFRHLAQICDARTAVSLARSGADVRWFLPVHMKGCMKNPKLMLADLHDTLANLRPNSCVDNFCQKYFPEQFPHDEIDEFFTSTASFSSLDTDMLKEVISFLHHITKDVKIAEKIMKSGGLLHLMELAKIFADDNESLTTLCKVLANMSLVNDSVEHFFQSGWVGVLAEWQQCLDLRLQVISAKTMANLDHDDPNYSEYPPNVYPLHPRQRMRRKPKGDIVFIHGLLGGVFITWRQKDRKPIELGLYGKNAFYTNEPDDIFLVGDHSRLNGRKSRTINRSELDEVEKVEVHTDPPTNIKVRKTTEKPSLNISDAATKELVETLQDTAELEPDWEVVHPDVPLKANEGCIGNFSVSGTEWKNQDQDKDYTNCWPMEWLPEDHPNTRIIGIDYTSAVTEWSANFTKYCPCEKGQGHIDTRATSLLQRLSKANIGNDCPVVWIGHSMGGILTKLMLMKAMDDPDPQVQQMAKNTKGLVFLGTPHRGSPIAKWKQHMQMLLSPSIEVKEMEENAPRLIELHNRFMNCLNTCFKHVKVVSIAEGSPTMLTSFKFPLRIVTEESARINHGDFYVLKDDHLSLSKPIFKQSFLYQRMLQVIEESLDSESSDGKLKEMLPGSKLHAQKLKDLQAAKEKKSKDIYSVFPLITFDFLPRLTAAEK